MSIHFYKYQGTGNDFILFDNRSEKLPKQDVNLYHNLCDRRFGIGADGVILLEPDDQYDFYMRYFNADGHLGSMCGNGGRCIVDLAYQLEIINKKTTFAAYDGSHKAQWENSKRVKLKMHPVEQFERQEEAVIMNTGSPHYVTFQNDIDKLDVLEAGRKIRYSATFKKDGINVNFVEAKNDKIYVRTYERGVEAETLSCGTGVIASALSSVIAQHIPPQSPITVETPGGTLEVYFRQNGQQFEDIWLVGPTQRVFEGEITL